VIGYYGDLAHQRNNLNDQSEFAYLLDQCPTVPPWVKPKPPYPPEPWPPWPPPPGPWPCPLCDKPLVAIRVGTQFPSGEIVYEEQPRVWNVMSPDGSDAYHKTPTPFQLGPVDF
jgi:hypothetical protein